MKTILENKTTVIRMGNSEDAPKLTYRNLLNSVISRQAVDTAWTLEDLRVRLAVLDKIEDSEKEMSFDEKELALVKKEVSESKWTLAHIEIINFVDYVNSL